MTTPLSKSRLGLGPLKLDPALDISTFPSLEVPHRLSFFETSAPPLSLSGNLWPLRLSLWKFPAALKTTPPPRATPLWFDTLLSVAQGIESMDLDFYHLPVNRGNNLCRYSEYTPKTKRPEACTIRVNSDTRARAHGEIRPIKGLQESYITRVTVDFDKNVINHVKTFPDLEIDGFAAVDPPEITFDWKRLPKNPVTALGEGNWDYENPLGKNQDLATPFDSVAPAPPGNHDYWMFRFSPIPDSLIATAETAISDGELLPDSDRGLGALLLWAYLPTVGLDDPRRYADLGIPFNTFPRRFADLLKLFTPLFDVKQRTAALSQAPLINPNTEYVDETGVRRKIPEDARKVVKINERHKKLGLPLISRNRGAIIDWTFGDLARDLKRLAATPEQLLPRMTMRMKLKGVPLHLPWGEVKFGEGTEARVEYALKKLPQDSGDAVLPRRELRLEISPLELNSVDLDLGAYRLKAKGLKIKNIQVDLPDLGSLSQKNGNTDPKVTVSLEGIRAEEIFLEESHGLFKFDLKNLNWRQLEFQYGEKGWSLVSRSIKAQPLRVQTALGDFHMDEAALAGKLTLSQSYDDVGRPKQLSLHLPQVSAKGELRLGGETDSGAQVQIQGDTLLKNIDFYRVWDGKLSRLYTTFEVESDIPNAILSSPELGRARFTTQPQGKARDSQTMTGKFRSFLSVPNGVSTAPAGRPEYLLDLFLPVVGVETSGRLNIPPGSSTIKDAHLSLSPGKIRVGGSLDLSGGSLSGLGEGETQLGTFLLKENSPKLSDITLKGRVVFEKTPGGWRLGRPADSTDSIDLRFKMGPSGLTHSPDLTHSAYAKRKSSQVIQSDLTVNSAQVALEDFQSVAYQGPQEKETRGQLRELKSGPITLSDIQAEGVLWVNLVVWGFVRGLFPHLGSGETKDSPSKKGRTRPDPAVLTRHLDAAVQKQLGSGDFIRLGGIRYEKRDDGTWENSLQDLLMNLHEAGGRKQFGMLRIPEVRLGESSQGFYFNLGQGDYWLNVYLKDPDRGGAFRFVRWPKPNP